MITDNTVETNVTNEISSKLPTIPTAQRQVSRLVLSLKSKF